jgi:hypothetical protein
VFSPSAPGQFDVQVPADAVIRDALGACMSGKDPILSECQREGGRPGLGMNLKGQWSHFTRAESILLRFLHFVCRKLNYTDVRYPHEDHYVIGGDIIDAMKSPHDTIRKGIWSESVEREWIKQTKKLEPRVVQESLARLIAADAIVLDRVVACSYRPSVEGGRRSKLLPGNDIETKDTRRNSAAVLRVISRPEKTDSTLIHDFLRDTDPTMVGRSFSGSPQMYGSSVVSSMESGSFTVKGAVGSQNRVLLRDRNYMPDDDVGGPPLSEKSLFPGTSEFIDASTTNIRARECHLARIFPNIVLDEQAPLVVAGRNKRRSEEDDDDDDDDGSGARPASAPRLEREEPDESIVPDPDESDLEPELDWIDQSQCDFSDEEEGA